jgi:hypothetical protein
MWIFGKVTLPIPLMLIYAIFSVANASLTLVNLSQIPIKNELVALPADKIYSLLGIKSGTPLRFLSPKGEALPTYFDGNFIWVLASLPAGGKVKYDVSPAKSWSSFPEVETKWEPEARKGILKNKFLNLEVKEGKISLYTIEGKSLLEGIHFYGWLTEEAIQVPNYKWAEEQGLPRISTLDFSSIQPKEITPYSLAIRKEAGGKLKGRIAYVEKFILHPTLPLIEYRLELENITGKPLFIADCDGVIRAGWGEAMKGRRDLILPQGEKIPITEDWMEVSEGQIPPKDRVWMLVNCENRQALGLFNLSKHIYSWCFTDKGMFLFTAGEEGERPIKIPAGGKVSFGIAFCLFENESQASQDAPAILRYLREGPPITAFLSGEPISLGTVSFFEDDFQRGRFPKTR